MNLLFRKNLDTGLRYAITNGISKIPIDPTFAKKFNQGQILKITVFSIFLNGQCY